MAKRKELSLDQLKIQLSLLGNLLNALKDLLAIVRTRDGSARGKPRSIEQIAKSVESLQVISSLLEKLDLLNVQYTISYKGAIPYNPARTPTSQLKCNELRRASKHPHRASILF